MRYQIYVNGDKREMYRADDADEAIVVWLADNDYEYIDDAAKAEGCDPYEIKALPIYGGGLS